MSAPDPEKWELTEDEAEEIGAAVDLYGTDSPEFLGGFEMVARRRALAELRALAEDAREEPNQLQLCPVFTVRLDDIRRRIAEIEAEEA